MAEVNYKLYLSNLPVIDDLQTLADYTHLSKGFLYKISIISDRYYKEFQIPKKSGGFRTIACPSRPIKAVQAWILRNILDTVHVTESATGFRTGKNLLFNVEPHKNNRYILCLDIDDFFPSVQYPKVYNVFRTLGYNPHISHVFTSICTYNGTLPQGGVTSPALSNIVCIRLDRRIVGYTGKRNITFTRYADDMTFSCMSQGRLVGAKRTVEKIVTEEGFRLNPEKTRFIGPRRQRKITGLVIGDDTVGVGRKRKKEAPRCHSSAIHWRADRRYLS